MGTTLIPPTETVEDQRARALREANDRRRAKKILIGRMSALPAPASLQMACDILEDPPEVLGGVRTHQLLMGVRGLGAKSSRKICGYADVPELVCLRDLRPGERKSLVTALRMRAGTGRRTLS